ncbi:MAG: O-antigen ligase family protein [Bacteroidaceae bacterium]|nr:O-antigen ligase family protein [Bacteroidaceae bacterium]
MKDITKLLLLIIVIASVCSIDKSVPDCAIMGKWVGAGGAVLVSILVVSITALFTHSNKGGTTIRAGDMSWPFALAGIAVLMHCFLQLSGVLKHINGGGPGVYAAVAGFDNPAGVAAALTVCLPFMGYFSLAGNSRHPLLVRLVAYAVFLLSLILMAVIGSRAGIIATGVVLVLFLAQGTDAVRLRRALLVAAVAAVAVTAVALSVQKRASSTGRMLILNVCWDMIKERPLLGHGLHGFHSQYMIYQALFLDRCRSEVMDMLADNVTHPLNEYVLLAVNFGITGVTVIIGIAVMIVRFCMRHPSRDGFTGLSVIAGIAVLAMFSYPFRYPLTAVALTCALMMVFREPAGRLTDRYGKTVCAVSAVLSAAGLALFLPWAASQHRWGRVSSIPDNAGHHTDTVIKEYEALLGRLGNDPYFLYSYAYALADAERNGEAVSMAGESQRLMANYDTVLFMAEQESLCGDTDKAEQHYLLASRMCPVRFVPLYGLFCLYEEQGRFDEMKSMGQAILNKRIKVKSPEVSRIRLAVRQGMMMHNL